MVINLYLVIKVLTISASCLMMGAVCSSEALLSYLPGSPYGITTQKTNMDNRLTS